MLVCSAMTFAAEPFEGFLQKHCVGCHGPKKSKGDLRLDQLSRDFKPGVDGQVWAEVVEKINAGEMPPEDEPQPTADEIGKVIAEGAWPADGTEALKGQPVQLSLAWHPRYLYQEFHVADIWLDATAMKVASTRQTERHNRYIRHRWMPARVNAVKYGKFGLSGQMAVAENTLRTYWQNHDGMEGKIESVTKLKGEAPFGSSGIQVQFSMNLVLEGFRPGRLIRIRPQT